MKIYVDKKNRFIELFKPNNGFYLRTGILEAIPDVEIKNPIDLLKNVKDSGRDPFMRNFPNLLDIGIMETCVCAHKCNVDCYQKAINRTGKNMSVEQYRNIMEQCKDKVFSVALGGAGDVDTHENFEEILQITREYGIVPNFTTSGIMMTPEKAEICKKYCGAIAVSWHEGSSYTEKAIQTLLDAGVKTNIHYVLGRNSIKDAIHRLKTGGFPKGINAIVFLLYKPVGLGRKENVLQTTDEDVKTFFELIDEADKFPFKIGFDSCTCPAIINFTKKINMESMDTCEGGRFSAYITADMKMLPCSFDNQELRWAVDLNTSTIQEAWDSKKFNDFRSHFKHSCPGCKHRESCMGSCPIRREIVLCNNPEKNLK